jgi:hypothetical protein
MNRSNINENNKKDINELASRFASNTPKDFTFNMSRTNKYFNKSSMGENTERTTIKDDLIYNNNNNKVQPSLFEVYKPSSINASTTHTHRKTASKVLIVDKSIVLYH